MKIFVRFKTSGGIDKEALALLAEHGTAMVSNVTKVKRGRLSIHSATALSFVGAGYADTTEDGIEITDAGRERAERINETPAARKRRKMRESLEAQASGKWKPAPAGASSAAQTEEWWAQQDWAKAKRNVAQAHDQINWVRRMIRLARDWGTPEEVRDWEQDLVAAEADLERAIHERDALARKQKRAA